MKEQEIEVRHLSGESRRFVISPNKTVGDLKTLVSALAFSPTPAFHLFFKGGKLNLKCCIGALGIGDDDFLVLIPFTKKQKIDGNQVDAQMRMSKPANTSKVADFAYVEMMQEFSSVQDRVQEDSDVPCPLDASSSMDKGSVSKIVDHEDMPSRFLTNLVQSSPECITEGKNCEDFVKILESRSCLRKPKLGRCGFFFLSDETFRSDELDRCTCPVWLSHIVKVFSFVNIYSTFIRGQKGSVTVSGLKKAMDQLMTYGFKSCFQDIENLSVICPEVVSISCDKEFLSISDHVILVLNVTQPEYDQIKDSKKERKANLLKIVNSMKKREIRFQKHLWEGLKLYLEKRRKPHRTLLSIEDFLEFLKTSGTMKARRAKANERVMRHATSSRTQCKGTDHLSPVEMVGHLRDSIGSSGQIVHIEHVEARRANVVDVPNSLSIYSIKALDRLGISKLYCHQAESILASLAGRNVVVSTMTSSGKSLCYNIPVLEVLSKDMSTCALYLFPTKALAQDQFRVLSKMMEKLSSSRFMGIYDGDTSNEDRSWLRANARLLITNPDMLHLSILPYHKQFSRILANLRFVVIDEAHAYKGVFGCHTALIIRRLLRLCSHVYGSEPAFIFSTATLANPREHCMELANLSTLELVQNDGSPSAEKLFVLWNPSSCRFLNSAESKMNMDSKVSENRNSSPILEVSYLLAEMVQHRLRCIAFCRSRKLTEIILSYTREILLGVAPDLADSVCAYRAGYIAEDRRRIENDFFSGKLYGMVATNALELGIDVGHVDATLHLGFPGSIASLWQQAGRSGRREKVSLAVYVAFEGPLDQYFMKFPKKLFGGQIECCHIDSKNPHIVKQHLVCAAFEHPLSLLYDEKYFGRTMQDVIKSDTPRELSFHQSLDPAARRWSYVGEKMPSSRVSIRSIEDVRYQLIDLHKRVLLEEIEESKAFFQIHEGAIYMHQGKTYLVKELNLSEKVALCQEAKVKYYTKTRDYTDIHVISGKAAYPTYLCENQSLNTAAQAQECTITTTWFGFYCIQKGTNKVLDTVDLSLPQYSYQTQAVWIRVHQPIKNLVEEKCLPFRGGLHAASHAILNVVPLFVRCNLTDLGPECPNPHDTRYYPERILVYDQHQGGSGLCMKIQPLFTEILNAALELLTSCHCSGHYGCPNCIQSMVCHEYNEDINKDAAIMIIEGVLKAEREHFSSPQGC